MSKHTSTVSHVGFYISAHLQNPSSMVINIILLPLNYSSLRLYSFKYYHMSSPSIHPPPSPFLLPANQPLPTSISAFIPLPMPLLLLHTPHSLFHLPSLVCLVHSTLPSTYPTDIPHFTHLYFPVVNFFLAAWAVISVQLSDFYDPQVHRGEERMSERFFN